jgi:peptidoglycan-N-acetylglucosamine deacetylase
MTSSPWPWPLLLKASVVAHGLALAVVIAWPSTWLWVVAFLVFNHLLITACGLIPRCAALGLNHRRLPDSAAQRRAWSLTLDDGPDPQVTPQVLDLLAKHRVKATFFCVGERAAQHPALVGRIVAEGHSVQNHSQVHAHSFSLWGPSRIAHELQASQRTLGQLTGTAPSFFRAPAGLRNPFLAPALHRAGLQLVSWTRRGYDTQRGDPAQVLARLLPALDAGAILLLHDGHSATSTSGEPVVLKVLPTLLQAAEDRGLHAVTLPEGFADNPQSRALPSSMAAAHP